MNSILSRLKALSLKKTILPILTAVVLVGVGTWGQIQGSSKETKISEQGLQELFHTVLYHIEHDYVENEDKQTLMFGAIRGMLEALDDPHTRFMTPEQYKELQVETRGNFGGLGIEISIRDDILTVVSPIDGTPAMRAGMKPGDKIVEINKESTRGITLIEAVKKLRGTPGSSVNITVAREGEEELIYLDIVREIIKIEVVSDKVIKPENIGYVRLKQFSATATRDLARVLNTFKQKKVKGIILDLRWNPGGLLDAAYKISNFFVRDGVIVSTRGRKQAQDRVYTADPSRVIVPEMPLVILANEGSASASEIVTGAIKDHKRGTFVGTKTFGKGSVQNVIPLGYNTAIALTVQKYYTPSNKSIHKKGIKPDIEVKPLEFTKNDKRHYRELDEKGIIKKFVDENPGYTEANVKKFRDMVDDMGLDLSEFAAKRTLKTRYNATKKTPLFDLEFDVQLKRAIAEIKKQAS